MGVPRVYRTAGENVVSYGYTDIATGKARTNIYAGLTSGAGGVKGILANVPFYSDEIIYAGAAEKRFYLDFNLPQTIEGQTIIQVPLINKGGGGAEEDQAWVLVGFGISGANGYSRPYSGIISGASTSILTHTNQCQTAYKAIYLDFPRTTFKKGDQLIFFTDCAGSGTAYIAADPMGRAGGNITGSTSSVISGSTITSALIIQTPFIINT